MDRWVDPQERVRLGTVMWDPRKLGRGWSQAVRPTPLTEKQTSRMEEGGGVVGENGDNCTKTAIKK